MEKDRGSEHPGAYRLEVLGGWNLSWRGTDLEVPLRMQRLIARLGVAGPALRPVLCGVLWPESSEPHALDSLRVTIHHIGRELPGVLSLRGATVGLAPGVVVDLEAERAALCAGDGTAVDVRDSHAQAGPLRPEPELLPGWYEEWVLAEQHLLRDQRIRHHARHAQHLLDAGDRRGAVDAAARAQALDPLDEWAIEVLVRAHIGLGATCAARRALAAFRSELQGEFGRFASPLADALELLAARPAWGTAPGATPAILGGAPGRP